MLLSVVGTIALGLRGFQTSQAATGGRWHLLTAANTVMVIPVIVIFLGVQRNVINGITLSGFGGRNEACDLRVKTRARFTDGWL